MLGKAHAHYGLNEWARDYIRNPKPVFIWTEQRIYTHPSGLVECWQSQVYDHAVVIKQDSGEYYGLPDLRIPLKNYTITYQAADLPAKKVRERLQVEKVVADDELTISCFFRLLVDHHSRTLSKSVWPDFRIIKILRERFPNGKILV